MRPQTEASWARAGPASSASPAHTTRSAALRPHGAPPMASNQPGPLQVAHSPAAGGEVGRPLARRTTEVAIKEWGSGETKGMWAILVSCVPRAGRGSGRGGAPRRTARLPPTVRAPATRVKRPTVPRRPPPPRNGASGAPAHCFRPGVARAGGCGAAAAGPADCSMLHPPPCVAGLFGGRRRAAGGARAGGPGAPPAACSMGRAARCRRASRAAAGGGWGAPCSRARCRRCIQRPTRAHGPAQAVRQAALLPWTQPGPRLKGQTTPLGPAAGTIHRRR